MVDLDLDELKRLAKAHGAGGAFHEKHPMIVDPQTVLSLIAQLRELNDRVKRAEATIAEAKLQIECDESGDAWRILATYQNGADHDA